MHDGVYFLVEYCDVCWQSDYGIDFNGIRRELKVLNCCKGSGDETGSGKGDRIAGYHKGPLRLVTMDLEWI